MKMSVDEKIQNFIKVKDQRALIKSNFTQREEKEKEKIIDDFITPKKDELKNSTNVKKRSRIFEAELIWDTLENKDKEIDFTEDRSPKKV